MRRSPAPLLACLLALLTAGVLLRAEALLTVPAPTLGPIRTEENKEVVRRFYAAVNAALATGDLAPLKAVVAPDFVVHDPQPGLSPNRAGLARELLALRVAAPGFRVTPETVLADGDEVIAQVAEAHRPTAFLGLPVPSRLALWGEVDRFRVTDGRVAEHWSDTERAWLEPLARAPFRLHPPAWRTATLERRTLAPGTRTDVGTVGPRLLVLVDGRLTAAVAASQTTPGVLRVAGGPAAAPAAEGTSRSVRPGTEVTLEPGQALLFDQGTRATLRTAGRTAAATLEVTLEPPTMSNEYGAGAEPNATIPVDISKSTLGGGVIAPLPPGATITAHTASGPELLNVEAGSLEVTTSDGSTWHTQEGAGPSELEPTAVLATGAGLFVEPEAVVAVRNAGETPLVLLVATLMPADPAEGTSAPVARP